MQRKRKLTEFVDEIYSNYERSREQFNVKQVREAVLIAYERGDIAGDPIADAVDRAVSRRDKASRQAPDQALMFEEFAFPRSLVLGDQERMPSGPAKLEHVLANQVVKQTNNIRQNQAFLRDQQRDLRVLPYLQQGMTVAEACAAVRGEHGEAA